MAFDVSKVKVVNCPKCGVEVDVSAHKPLSSIECPDCGGNVAVPVRMGHMLLTERIGQGTAGIVYQALDTILDRPVAVKILRDVEGAGNERRTEDSNAEAQALAAINHPNVVRIHDIGAHRDQHYIEMELLTGGSVVDLVAGGTALPERRALEIALDAARALRAAHDVGLVHRDVKPQNLLLDGAGVARLLDFGSARFGEEEQEKLGVGTPLYISPEAVRQQPLDFRSDVYSLGCTLFEMLSGRPPFDGEDPKEICLARLKLPAPNLSEIKPGLNPKTVLLVVHMLRRDPDNRHGNYDELITEMQSALKAVEQAELLAQDPTGANELRKAAEEAALTSSTLTLERNRAQLDRIRTQRTAARLAGAIALVAFALLIGLILYFRR
ncbi:MAG: serine/threonine protein kinase [Phycisphaerae bacterium]|nr:serine/threonine protein kinase [Phycisphaerae bacterium]